MPLRFSQSSHQLMLARQKEINATWQPFAPWVVLAWYLEQLLPQYLVLELELPPSLLCFLHQWVI
jgi:hypothetical protein